MSSTGIQSASEFGGVNRTGIRTSPELARELTEAAAAVPTGNLSQ
jgi:hypothetical protein